MTIACKVVNAIPKNSAMSSKDLSIKESYDRTWAKSYDGKYYDEWDIQKDKKRGAQAWANGNGQYGASAQDFGASQGDWRRDGGYDRGYGYGGQYGARDQLGASQAWAAQRGSYDGGDWARQAYGAETGSRWGKSYDAVDAKSYEDEQYAR